MNYIGANKYLMYGGIEAAAAGGQVKPNNDVYTLRMMRDKWVWEKQNPSGEELPPARSQHVAEVLPPTNDKMFVFGGHSTPTVRLNDTWFFNTKEFVWTRGKGDKKVEQNKESAIGAPPPRANAGSCVYKNKVYIYGGHGGLNYARVCLDDIHTYDLATETWAQVEINVGLQLPPPGRGGHSIFIMDDKLYAYGGWNHESVYNKIEMFDLETREWSDPDIYNMFPGPRWNHSAVMVEAIPAWKYFIFGGESANFHEGQPRSFGTTLQTACYLDMESLVWAEIKPESKVTPPPREYASLCYDADDSKLITFGGWHNGWMNDLWCLNVNKVVGPPYSISTITPSLGRLSGQDQCVITGVGFRDNTPLVYFTPGTVALDAPGKNSVVVPGIWQSATEITCFTPDFALHGPRECVVQLIMSSKDLTTTHCDFHFFKNTVSHKSLCYGTGLLEDMAVGEPVEFFIQARNEDSENRGSGRDAFTVRIYTDDEEKADIPCEIVDNANGTYTVKYQVDKPTGVKIMCQFKNEKEEVVPVRGSPYKATFIEDAAPRSNVTIGPSLAKAAQGMIENMQGFMRESLAGVKLTDKDLTDVKTLLNVSNHEVAVRTRNDEITLILDQL
jgi:dynein heavy chain